MKPLSTLQKMTIKRGSHANRPGDLSDPTKVNACIMEAINYIRHGVVNADPPCVSDVIKGLMICRNDSRLGEPERNKLKVLVKDIINTAPTKLEYDADGYPHLVTANSPAHDRVEQRRMALVKRTPSHLLGDREFNQMIREMAAVRKYENADK